MNNKSFIHICRFVLVLLLVSVPFKAFAESTTYYAKVFVHNADDTPTGAGTIYVDSPGSKESSTKSASSSTGSSANVSFTLHANASSGFRFAGWTQKPDGTGIIGNSNIESYTATVSANSTSESNPTKVDYYAVFVAQTIYYARLSVEADSRNTGTGRVFINGNNVLYADATSDFADVGGSQDLSFTLRAEPDEGCKFIGWSEVNGTGIVSTDNPHTYTVTATSSDETNPTSKTIYAVFMRFPSITISISGSNYGQGENVVFNVNKTDSPTTSYTVPVRIASSNQVTIKNVPIGTYSVTANGWAWNYTVTPTTANTGVSVLDDTEFSFTVVGKGSTKEYDEKSKVNWGN